MILFLLAYLGGVLTIVSPCILPVLPFVFTRAGQPVIKSLLPLLIGMALTFAAVATLASVGGSWVVRANEFGRLVALAVLAIFGLALLWQALGDRLTRPLTAAGNRLTAWSDIAKQRNLARRSFVLGIATGFVWAPCAGPILGLVLTGAALQGANVQSSLLLLSYAAGAATSIFVALMAGGTLVNAMKRSLGAGEWIRRLLGAAALASVLVIATGADTGFLTQLSIGNTTRLEQALVHLLHGPLEGPGPATTGTSSVSLASSNPSSQAASEPSLLDGLRGAVEWLNSPPLTTDTLRGKAVLVDFWTYSCINCLRTLPYVRGWAAKYRNHGLVIIGVHTPEFAFERDIGNVTRAVHDLNITYPVAIDSNYAIWRAFNNDSWPADYLIDATGRLRDMHVGEGDYQQSEAMIQAALIDAGDKNVPGGFVDGRGSGIEQAPDIDQIDSPETYIGYLRARNFMSPGGEAQDEPKIYSAPVSLALNQWALAGPWMVGTESAVLGEAPGRVVFRFHARDLHLVLGPAPGGKPVRFRVMLDGKVPGADHGVDTDANGDGSITDVRLYQLVRQSGEVRDRVFSIEFLDPGAQAFSFTFG